MGESGIAVERALGGALRGGAGAVAGDGEEGADSLLRRRGAALIGSINNLSLASAIVGRTRTDDFLDADMGKHDYDWLLTPPATPNFSSSEDSENQLMPMSTKAKNTVKSASTARASRLSASQQENGHSIKPMRSSSVNRPSISTTHSKSLLNNKTSSLNTSTASATSRPSTPSKPSTNGTRPASLSSTRASAVSRPVQARSVNPAKTRPSLTSAGDKPRPSQSSRSSTPTRQPQLPSTNLYSSAIRSTSRPSTPTHRLNTPVSSSSPATTAGRSPSAGRLTASRTTGFGSRPNSPGLRPRAPVSSFDPTLFSHETPPNLRTKLPEKPSSVGRTRPGMALTVRASSNTEAPTSVGSVQKHLLPSVARSKLSDNSAKHQFSKSDHDPVLHEIQKSAAPEPGGRRASKAGLTDGSGFGRTISKMSLDMALKHMDIRQSIGGIRANTVFPHSNRAVNASKPRPAHAAEPVSENGHIAEKAMNKDGLITKGSDVDLYGSSRYNTMLMIEDSMNTNWLHSVEDKSDQSPVFDRRFDPPPEPFGPL